MLLYLTLADFVLVDSLSLEFASGFSVFTGETGAGKSILVDALTLVLGGRADAGMVREGAVRAEVAAEFDLHDQAALGRWLAENELTGDADALLLRRTLDDGGRSRAYVNGRPVTVQQLRQAGEMLVDIHGQHAHYSLLKPAEQRRLLDTYAGSDALAHSVAQAWQGWRQARDRHDSAARNSGETDIERERLTSTVREIEALNFSVEGWRTLQDEHRRLAHAAELIQGAQAAALEIEDDDAGITARLKATRTRLHDLVEIDPALSAMLESVTAATDALRESAHELARYADRVDLDAERLDEAERRLAAVQGLARKHRLPPEDLADCLDAARARLAELGEGSDLQSLAAAETEAWAAYETQARQLGSARRAAADRLADSVAEGMHRLAMRGGRFEVAFTPCEPGVGGLESVEFMVSPNAGQGLKPLAGTASGGELSRIGLALQTVLADVQGAATLIFDEVDAGIGGAVAEVVGRLLADLGRQRQVLCVTHLPQVAACASGHYRVSKEQIGGRACTRVEHLRDQARVDELARMLGGVKITAATRAHAAEMLHQAAEVR